MRVFHNQVLAFKDDTKQVIGIYEESGIYEKGMGGQRYCLYFRKLNLDGKWDRMHIMGRFDDFYQLLYMAGELARMQCMFEGDR